MNVPFMQYFGTRDYNEASQQHKKQEQNHEPSGTHAASVRVSPPDRTVHLVSVLPSTACDHQGSVVEDTDGPIDEGGAGDGGGHVLVVTCLAGSGEDVTCTTVTAILLMVIIQIVGDIVAFCELIAVAITDMRVTAIHFVTRAIHPLLTSTVTHTTHSFM